MSTTKERDKGSVFSKRRGERLGKKLRLSGPEQKQKDKRRPYLIRELPDPGRHVGPPNGENVLRDVRSGIIETSYHPK